VINIEKLRICIWRCTNLTPPRHIPHHPPLPDFIEFGLPGLSESFYFWEVDHVFGFRIGIGEFEVITRERLVHGHVSYHTEDMIFSPLSLCLFPSSFFFSFRAGVERAQIPPLLENLIHVLSPMIVVVVVVVINSCFFADRDLRGEGTN
jgi:hypothetical protein